MYTIELYAVCVGFTLLIGAALFAGCAALLIVKDVCLMLVDMTGRIFVRVRFSAARGLSVHPLIHFEGSCRRGWTGVVVSHRAVPARSLIRMR
jgi:hypothetical protein